jgi:hypothetical protein
MRKIFLLLALLAGRQSALTQNLNFYGFLPSYSQTGLISKKFDYNFFASTTYSVFDRTFAGVEYPAKFLQIYVQPSIIYKHSPNLNFSVSFTYNYQRNNPLALYFNEYRPWQQVIYSHNLFKIKGRMAHRIRFEQRLIKTKVDSIRRFTTRLRYQIGYMLPLQGKTLDAHEFYLNMYNEFYFSLSNPPAPRLRSAFYSENWTYLGIGYNTGKMGRIEVGPLYQGAYRSPSMGHQHNRRNLSMLQVLWVTNFNPPKKKK